MREILDGDPLHCTEKISEIAQTPKKQIPN